MPFPLSTSLPCVFIPSTHTYHISRSFTHQLCHSFQPGLTNQQFYSKTWNEHLVYAGDTALTESDCEKAQHWQRRGGAGGGGGALSNWGPAQPPEVSSQWLLGWERFQFFGALTRGKLSTKTKIYLFSCKVKARLG